MDAQDRLKNVEQQDQRNIQVTPTHELEFVRKIIPLRLLV